MVSSAAEMPAFPFRHTKAGSALKAGAHVVIGTSGALNATDTTYDHPDITVTPSGSTTGLYAITFPPCLSVRPSISIVYASSTTTRVYGSVAPAATAGTWSVQFCTADGTGAWPASTDQFDIHLEMITEDA